MKILATPHYDSDNSNPPVVEFEENQHTITIRLFRPDREVQIEKDDFRRLTNLFVKEDANLKEEQVTRFFNEDES